jgi:hypothetical protein
MNERVRQRVVPEMVRVSGGVQSCWNRQGRSRQV